MAKYLTINHPLEQLEKIIPVTKDGIPMDFIGNDVSVNDDGSYSIVNDKGVKSTGFPGESYWVIYGRDGSNVPKAEIVTLEEKDCILYETENGDDIFCEFASAE